MGQWISFADSKYPWKLHGKEERSAISITDGYGFIVRSKEEHRERMKSKRDVVLDIGIDKIWNITSVYHAQLHMDEW